MKMCCDCLPHRLSYKRLEAECGKDSESMSEEEVQVQCMCGIHVCQCIYATHTVCPRPLRMCSLV